MCGVADEGAGGLVVAFALCGESFMEDGHRKEEEDAASVDDNGGDNTRSAICPWEATLVDPEWRSIRFRKEPFRFRAKLEQCRRVWDVFVDWEDFVGQAW